MVRSLQGQAAETIPRFPGWEHERRIARQGYRRVAGLDEVGRGSLAGPVVVAAVILTSNARIEGLNDSKLLTAVRRGQMVREILRNAEAWGIGAAGAEEIDDINILRATYVAMERAISSLPVEPDHLLIDAIRLPGVRIAQTSLIKGDRISVSIAAASIVAKVVRDQLMSYYDRLYPGFGFAANKGYGTPDHLRAVAARGASRIHRRTFRSVERDPQLSFGETLGH